MPRKAPSQVRSDLPRPPSPWDSRAVIPGISGKALADIARVERRRYAPGAAWHALRHWRGLVYQRGPWVMYPSFGGDHPCCDPPWTGEHRQVRPGHQEVGLWVSSAVLPRMLRRQRGLRDRGGWRGVLFSGDVGVFGFRIELGRDRHLHEGSWRAVGVELVYGTLD